MPTSFTSLYNLVVKLTGKAAIQHVTESAIRSATLRAHAVADFYRDLETAQLSYSVSASTSQIYNVFNISQSMANYRKVGYVRGVNSFGAVTEKFEYRDPDDLWDENGVIRHSTFTLEGDTLKLIPTLVTELVAVGYYRNPSVSTGAYSSWIADMHEDDIALWAAGIVHSRSGSPDLASSIWQSSVIPFQHLLKEQYLTPVQQAF